MYLIYKGCSLTYVASRTAGYFYTMSNNDICPTGLFGFLVSELNLPNVFDSWLSFFCVFQRALHCFH